MFTLFAHAGHSHTATSLESTSTLDHCLPVIIGTGIIIAILSAAIIYLLVTWQPKKPLVKTKSSNRKK